MTNQQMESLNRRTRMRQALRRNEALSEIATREGVTAKYLYSLARGWKIPIHRGVPRCLQPWGLQ